MSVTSESKHGFLSYFLLLVFALLILGGLFHPTFLSLWDVFAFLKMAKSGKETISIGYETSEWYFYAFFFLTSFILWIKSKAQDAKKITLGIVSYCFVVFFGIFAAYPAQYFLMSVAAKSQGYVQCEKTASPDVDEVIVMKREWLEEYRKGSSCKDGLKK